MQKLFHNLGIFFDKLEDRVRAALSLWPIMYAFVGGVAIVIFWRGVWHVADKLEFRGGWFGFLFSPEISLLISVGILLVTGLFVSFFVGDVIILSGIKREKKLVERTESEIEEESDELARVEDKLIQIEKEIKKLEQQRGILEESKKKV